ncbi:unnamed protein product [Rotaria sordida]|uniref:Uncharacterized protein n=1 Tax=Rotaria sordida TaxID=392033 RepID=A0A814UFH2_9BILA|nr:unnamed protein product [Rotaria sordida]
MASYYEMTNFQASMTVQQQPQEIKNVFGINSGEHILKTYECDETCCGCGDKKDLADALVDVPNAATPQKASCNNYLNAPSPSAPIATKPKKKKK